MAVLIEPPVRRRLFTVEEYHKLTEVGILHEDDHVELIEGELIQMAATGSRHIACVFRTNRWFNRRVGDRAIVGVQSPIRLIRSEPEPDIVLLRFREDDYESGTPEAADVLLLIEVAESSLAYDRGTKLLLYAAMGIPEYWLVDLDHQSVEVYRRPRDGRYGDVTVHERGARLTPLTFPDLAIGVDEILG